MSNEFMKKFKKEMKDTMKDIENISSQIKEFDKNLEIDTDLNFKTDFNLGSDNILKQDFSLDSELNFENVDLTNIGQFWKDHESIFGELTESKARTSTIDEMYEKAKSSLKVNQSIFSFSLNEMMNKYKSKAIISVKRAYDYFGGNIRFKVVVENISNEPIKDITVSLKVKEQFELKNPLYKIKLLESDESRGLDFLITPLSCGKSKIYGNVSFLDSNGKFNSMEMNPLIVHIKSPLVQPKQISPLEIEKIKRDIPKSHTMVYSTDISVSKVFQIAREQISSLDVAEISINEKNFYALFSGETKVTKEKFIIELSVKENSASIDVYLNDRKQATGFLAYIKNLIKLALQNSKQISITLEKIRNKIYNSFEFGLKLSELYKMCKNKEDIDNIMVILQELKDKSNSYFSNLTLCDDISGWLAQFEKIKQRKVEDRIYLNLIYDILGWMDSVIVFSETNSKNYLESPSIDDETHKKIEYGNLKLKKELKTKMLKYSNDILYALMLINKGNGVNIFTYIFSGEELDGDLISGFLTAIQSLGIEVTKKATAMKKLSYEDFEIELREGEFIRAALITTGFPDSLTKKRLDEM
ncbi:MAG: hypothetical protein ACTSR3_15300, partial [Candidatus Helarchaeota archaeon]